MRPSRHLALSLPAGGAVWAGTGEPWALPITVAAGVLADVDHGPDLWWNFVFQRKRITTFLFHGWEWLAILVGLTIWTAAPWWLASMLIGFGLHLITDQIANKGGPLAYFFTYRVWHRFDMAKIAPQWNSDHPYEVVRKELPPVAWLMDRFRSSQAIR